MAQFLTTQAAGLNSANAQLPQAELGYNVRDSIIIGSITMAAQAAGSTIVAGIVPKGRVVLSCGIQATVSLGSATISIGNASSAAKYMAATLLTSPGVSANSNLALTDPPTLSVVDEQLIATVGAAALPASGVLWIIARVAGI